MSTEELISIDPLELRFPFELKKQISSSFQLSNKTDKHLAFKVKTTNPKKYYVRPNNGVVLPRSRSSVIVTLQAQREAPPDMQCYDKFLVQCVVAPPGATPKDINPEMFNKEVGNHVEEYKLKVVYVPPPKPPSPVPEESEDDDTAETTSAKDLISKLTKEKESINHENEKLHQELNLLRGRKPKNGVSIHHVFLVFLIGILLGFYLKRS